jgi:lysophospholipase L1-like esterase
MKWLLLILLNLSCITQTPTFVKGFANGTLKYLALGDSYTIGESVPDNERWPVQLADMLRKETLDVASPDIIAKTGWTTAELAAGIKQVNPQSNYDLVSVLIGVNNQYRGQSMATYRLELRDILKIAIAFAKNRPERVFMLSTPDWGVTPFGASSDRAKIANEIDGFNAVAQEECKSLHIAYIDITVLSRTALNDASLVASDQLHFSGKMYQLWVNQSLPIVRELLKQ